MRLEPELEASVAGGRVELVFSVANVGTEPVTLRFDSDAAAEVVVNRGDETVWHWRDERRAADAGTPLRDQTLAPGDTVIHRAEWTDPPAGTYEAVGVVAARNVEATATASFEV